MDNLTETIWLKHVFSGDEIFALAQKMARAEANINEKSDQLKSVSIAIKAEIATQEGILHSSAEKLRSGYEMRPTEADVKYEKGIVKYVDKETGEIIEERPMTQEEQLRLSPAWVDAEKVIQQARDEETEKLTEEEDNGK